MFHSYSKNHYLKITRLNNTDFKRKIMFKLLSEWRLTRVEIEMRLELGWDEIDFGVKLFQWSKMLNYSPLCGGREQIHDQI